jgi:hypothetical protein
VREARCFRVSSDIKDLDGDAHPDRFFCRDAYEKGRKACRTRAT